MWANSLSVDIPYIWIFTANAVIAYHYDYCNSRICSLPLVYVLVLLCISITVCRRYEGGTKCVASITPSFVTLCVSYNDVFYRHRINCSSATCCRCQCFVRTKSHHCHAPSIWQQRQKVCVCVRLTSQWHTKPYGKQGNFYDTHFTTLMRPYITKSHQANSQLVNYIDVSCLSVFQNRSNDSTGLDTYGKCVVTVQTSTLWGLL